MIFDIYSCLDVLSCFVSSLINVVVGFDCGMDVVYCMAAWPMISGPAPATIQLKSGAVKPCFYVLVFTVWGYIPLQFLSQRLALNFVASCSMQNIVTVVCDAAKVAEQLAFLNLPENLVIEFGFHSDSGKIICNNLVAVHNLIPVTCKRLAFNQAPAQLPAPKYNAAAHAPKAAVAK